MLVYFNNEFVEDDEAKVSISNGGLLHGAGLFETMRVENGRVFRFEEHCARLLNSASALLRPMDRSELPDEDICRELLERNDRQTARLRLTITAGALRSEAGESGLKLTVILTASELTSYSSRDYDKGTAVIISRFRQNPTDPLAGHKTTCYLPRLIALRDAHQIRCSEALWFTTQNYLAEGSISNVFIVSNGVLKTPPLDVPVLPGIARAAVLDLAKVKGMQVEECMLTIDDLLDADEVFLTNAIMQAMPVVRVEKHDISDGVVGPVSRQLFEDYRGLVKKECSA